MKITTEYLKDQLTKKFGKKPWKRITKRNITIGILREFSGDPNTDNYYVLTDPTDTRILEGPNQYNDPNAVLSGGLTKFPIVSEVDLVKEFLSYIANNYMSGYPQDDINEVLAMDTDDFHNLAYNCDFFSSMRAKSGILFDFENFDFDGFYVTKSGVRVMKFYSGGDWESPVYFMIYKDTDTTFNMYLPTSAGYNINSMTAYGSECEVGWDEYDFSKPDGQPDKDMYGYEINYTNEINPNTGKRDVIIEYDESKFLSDVEDYFK